MTPKRMFLGLLLFGVLVGLTTGLSVTSGASTSLMTGLFSFVGGVVISYTGFAKTQGDPNAPAKPDLKQVGGALSALSFGVIVGIFGGMWFRYKNPLAWQTSPSNISHSSTSTPSIESIVGLNDGSIGGDLTTQRVVKRLVMHWYDNAPNGLVQATEDLGDLAKVCVQKCPAPTE